MVAGCGGGEPLAAQLGVVLSAARRLVLDADGLNAVAVDPGLRSRLRERASAGLASVLTPHPLEAARLLGTHVAAIQQDRLAAARALAQALQSQVVLKGSGTVIASPDGQAWINPTGNGRLASAGTGDVLAGWLGGHWSANPAGDDPAEAALADRKSTRLNSSHSQQSRMPSSA